MFQARDSASSVSRPRSIASTGRHIVQFYEDDEYLSEVAARFFSAGLSEGASVIVVATKSHRKAFGARLAASGFDLEEAGKTGQLVMLDARETLSQLMVGDRPDAKLFRQVIGGHLERSAAVSRDSGVRAYGEMVSLLWNEGNPQAALELEDLWNDLRRTCSFSLLCAYRINDFAREADGGVLQRICSRHDLQTADPDTGLRDVAFLQQRARALETEIERRKALEEALRERLTELRRSEEALRQTQHELAELLAREQAARARADEYGAKLAQAVRARDDFISIASHELRNPLSALQLQVTSVERAAEHAPERLSPGWVATRVGKARAQVNRLVRLIDSLLDVSRITAGRLELELEEVDLASVVRSIVDHGEFALANLVVHADQPSVGRWDRLRLEQVVTNLVSNAIKYGTGKPIEICVAPSEDRVTLTVTDHGIGMSRDAQQRLFERFERAVSTRKVGGFGLGLWITRQIVEALQGRIRVVSREGEGSTFIVELPRDRTPQGLS